jgi:hypothetical protein
MATVKKIYKPKKEKVEKLLIFLKKLEENGNTGNK